MEEFYERSFFFNLCQEEKQEILRHKWVLSEQAGRDVGYDVALFSWLRNHRQEWLQSQLKNKPSSLFG